MPPPADPTFINAILAAYREGWFPMGDPATGRVDWVQPRRRAILPLDPLPRFSRSLRSAARRSPLLITTDTAFEAVITACAAPSPLPGRDATWIDPAILDAFLDLHRAGHAHSIEVWAAPPSTPHGAAGGPTASPVLLGGLYGLAIGRAFMGESMFCRPDLGGSNASKLALLHLTHHLRRLGFTLLDSQIQNPHMKSLGAVEIPRTAYLKQLNAATAHHEHSAHTGPAWLPFEPHLTRVQLAPPP